LETGTGKVRAGTSDNKLSRRVDRDGTSYKVPTSTRKTEAAAPVKTDDLADVPVASFTKQQKTVLVSFGRTLKCVQELHQGLHSLPTRTPVLR
jgi:hypothetical protein